MPSIACPDSHFVYRLLLFDEGGDGWQGGSYRIYNSSSLADVGEGKLQVSGTLADGFEGHHWVCLVDGCYEMVVGGGSAESEISFEFIDEIGQHFSGLNAPYDDHFCVAGGDVFEHPTGLPTPLPSISPVPSTSPLPTAAPTPLPTPLPTSLPSAVPSALPTPAPTPVPSITTPPSPVPSPLPSPVPTREQDVAIALEIAGFACADYSTAEQTVVDAAVSTSLPGQLVGFSAHTCTDTGGQGRRRVSTSGAGYSVSWQRRLEDGDDNALNAHIEVFSPRHHIQLGTSDTSIV